jgi:hypothetical protein
MGRASGAAMLSAALLLAGVPLRAQAPAPDGGQVMGSPEDRIVWFFPNYRTVDEEKSLPRISAQDKLTIAAKDSFDPYAFPVAGLFGGINMAEDQYPSWGRGIEGYGRYFLGAFADQTVSNLMTEAVFPIALHQDPRYFRLGRGSILHRAGYAVSRVLVTRADLGEAEFNYSEFGGNAVMAATSTLYDPRQDRSFGDAAGKFGFQIAFDTLANVGKEFWPDVKRWLLRR